MSYVFLEESKGLERQRVTESGLCDNSHAGLVCIGKFRSLPERQNLNLPLPIRYGFPMSMEYRCLVCALSTVRLEIWQRLSMDNGIKKTGLTT